MATIRRTYANNEQGGSKDTRTYLGAKEIPYGDQLVSMIDETMQNFRSVLVPAEKEARERGTPIRFRLEIKIEQPEEGKKSSRKSAPSD